MGTYGTLKATITADCNRPDLSAQASQAVQTAINFYSSEPLGFNSDRAYIVTDDGQPNYALPDDFIKPIFLKLKRDSNWYEMDRVSWQVMESRKWDDTTTSLPDAYAIYDEQLWFYPIPDQSMTADLSYVRSLATLSASSDSNAWTGVAEELIRLHAEVDMYETKIRGADAIQVAQVLRGREHQALDRLRERFSGKLLSGKLRRRGIFWPDR